MSSTLRSSLSTARRLSCRHPTLTLTMPAFTLSNSLRTCCIRTSSPMYMRRSITTYSQLPSEHQMIYDMCRKLTDEEIAPNAKQWDKDHCFPTTAIHKLVRTFCCKTISSFPNLTYLICHFLCFTRTVNRPNWD
jgi:Acyl-CoA dehydrogenase, N-terminal domain